MSHPFNLVLSPSHFGTVFLIFVTIMPSPHWTTHRACLHDPPSPEQDSCQPRTTPLHVQELVEEIAEYLDQSSLARCAQVCRFWHEMFTPLLYRHVSLKKDVKLWTGIQEYSCYTRTLDLIASSFPKQGLFGPGCRHLATLSIAESLPDRWHPKIRALISLNPSIHTLHIHLDEVLDLFENNILQQMPTLKNLSIRCIESHHCDLIIGFEWILECCSRLESLAYHAPQNRFLERPVAHKDPAPWTKLSSLDITDCHWHQALELLKRSPNLRRLKVDCDALDSLIQHDSWRNFLCLEHLAVSDVFSSVVPLSTETGEARTSFSCGLGSLSCGLRSFSCGKRSMSEETIKDLVEYHGNSLEKVVLSKSVQGLELLFTLCPRLKHLEMDIGDGRWFKNFVSLPWACTGLQSLRLYVCSRRKLWDLFTWRKFRAQIEASKYLEILSIKSEDEPPSPHRYWLESDVEQCGLTRLRRLWIPKGPFFMDKVVEEDLRRRRPWLRIDFD